MTKLYAHWVNCIKEKCPESGDGKCRMGQEAVDFPADGKCLSPEYIDYEKEWEEAGAYETRGEEIMRMRITDLYGIVDSERSLIFASFDYQRTLEKWRLLGDSECVIIKISEPEMVNLHTEVMQ